MFRVTCIDLEDGEFALYINGHYLASEDGTGEKLYVEQGYVSSRGTGAARGAVQY